MGFAIVYQSKPPYETSMDIIDGKLVAEKVLAECSGEIADLKEKGIIIILGQARFPFFVDD